MGERYVLPLVKKEPIAEGTHAYWFDTKNSGFTFKAGQASDFTLISPAEKDTDGATRTFSIASSPTEESVMIATRNSSSAFKRALKEMPLGAPISIAEATGTLLLHDDGTKPAIFIAGGMGITPFRSMLRFVADKALPHGIFLFYSNPDLGSLAFYEELSAYAEKNPKFRFIPTLTQAQPSSWTHELGRVNEAMLRKRVSEEDRRSAHYYITGGPAFVTGILPMIERVGGDPDLIKTEEFPGY